MADMFLMLDGIKGESLDALYRDHIEVLGWQWHITNDASFSLSPADTVKKTSFDNLMIDKLYDLSSVTLINYCALGKRIPVGTLACRKNVGSHGVDARGGEINKMEYLILELRNIKVDKIDWPKTTDAQAVVQETVTLKFTEFSIVYQPQNERGEAVGAVDFGFDLSSHKQVGK
jgi:type VI secretion system secreted protein Hcp